MESKNGIYTMEWRSLEKNVAVKSSREALKYAQLMHMYVDETNPPKVSHPQKNVTIYEYDDVKFCVVRW